MSPLYIPYTPPPLRKKVTATWRPSFLTTPLAFSPLFGVRDPSRKIPLDFPVRMHRFLSNFIGFLSFSWPFPGSRILNPGSWILDPGSCIQDPGSRIQDPGSRILDPGSWIQDPGSRIQDPGSRIQDPGSWIQDPFWHLL